MNKRYVLFGIVLTLILTGGLIFFMSYLKVTFSAFETIITDKLDTIQHLTKTPDRALHKDCKYDFDRQNDDFLSPYPEYASYDWDHEAKVARIVLNDKSTLVVVRGGCHQYNCYITLHKKYTETMPDYQDVVIKEVLIHAQKLFDPVDYGYFVTALQSGEYSVNRDEGNYRMVFTHADYCHAEIFIINHGDSEISVKIGFTKC